MTIILGIPNLAGSILACFFDNTVTCIYCHTNEVFDSIMIMILGMPNLAGSIIACFLDNKLPGNYCYTNLLFDRIMTKNAKPFW